MALLNKRLQGSTMVEALVAMVVVTILLGLTAMVLANLWGSSIKQSEWECEQRMKEVLGDPFNYLSNKTEKRIAGEGYYIDLSVAPVEGSFNSFYIKAEAVTDAGKQLINKTIIIRKPDAQDL